MRCPTIKELPDPPNGRTGWPWTEESSQLPDKAPNSLDWPKITVVTPNYNYEEFLEETIRSVLLQGYPDLEYLVIDDGSTDGSMNIIKKYEKFLSYWTSQSNQGQSAAINNGWVKGNGEILAWINSDDILAPGALIYAGKFFAENPDKKWLVGTCGIIDGKSRRQDPFVTKFFGKDGFSFFWRGDLLPQPSSFWRKDILSPEKVTVREDLKYSMDFELWLRFLQKALPDIRSEVLAYYRMHERAHTVAQSNRFLKENVKVSREDWLKKGLRCFICGEFSWRRAVSGGLCAKAFRFKQREERKKATAMIAEAFKMYPLVIFSYRFINLALRLLLGDRFFSFFGRKR
ncbi:MAG: glycosyltransferase family 2 protein [Candidatus Omnitrophota bacterium]|nr:glycosyltransferase family 2 protein [Candidatus Omnitrophota bacterium]